MKSSRAIAAIILTQVFQGHSLTEALANNRDENNQHNLTQELCYGVLRWYWQLTAIIKVLLTRPLKEKDQDILSLLLIGLYQIIHLKIPLHAALNETVQAATALKKAWAKNLINGVLRQFLRQKEELFHKINRDPTTLYNHPSWLLSLLQEAWPTHWEKIIDANNQRPPMSLRVNCLVNNRDEYLKLLNENSIEAFPDHYSEAGIVLATPRSVDELPGFFEGKVSVQDLAAQLIPPLLSIEAGQIILDACAAPGGKTAHLLESMPTIKKLVAIDIDKQRCTKIQQTAERLHLHDRLKIIHADAIQTTSWWDKQLFDRILLDAPCSASGVIRRHPDIKLLRRPSDISKLAQTQLALLKALWPLLKPSGLLLYVTCSVLPQENTQVLKEFLTAHSDAKEKTINTDWGHPLEIGRQVLPGENHMDGFYFARLEKI